VFVLSRSEFIEKNTLTIKSSYYYRAADAGDGIFTFSVPFTGGLYLPAFIITMMSLVLARTSDSSTSDGSSLITVMNIFVTFRHTSVAYKPV